MYQQERLPRTEAAVLFISEPGSSYLIMVTRFEAMPLAVAMRTM
jgi:hypothetical protein